MKPAGAANSAAETIAKECVALRVRLLNRIVTGYYDEALREPGVRVGQLTILSAIACMRQARPADLCGLLCMDKSTLSRDVKVLRDRGWVEECASDDARMRPLRITAAGSRLLEKSLPAWRTAQAKSKKLLGEETIAAMFRAAGAIPPARAEH